MLRVVVLRVVARVGDQGIMSDEIGSTGQINKRIVDLEQQIADQRHETLRRKLKRILRDFKKVRDARKAKQKKMQKKMLDGE